MKPNQKAMWIFIVTFFGAFLTSVTAYIQYRDRVQSDKEATKSKLEAEDANQKLNQLLYEQKDSIQKVANLQANLLEANSQVIVLQKELLDNVTGNGNIPQLMILPASKSNSIIQFGVFLQNIHTTPIRGLEVVVNGSGILDQMTLMNGKIAERDLPNKLLDIAKYSQVKINVGDISIHGIKDVTPLFLMDTVQSFEYRITVNWDNGNYNVVIKGTNKLNKKWPYLVVDEVIMNHKKVDKHPFILAINMNE